MQFEQFDRGKPIVEAKVLGKKANPAARSYVARGAAQNLSLSAGGKHQTKQHFDGRALACAIGAQETENLAPRDFEGEVSDRHFAAEYFAKSAGADGEIGGSAHRCRAIPVQLDPVIIIIRFNMITATKRPVSGHRMRFRALPGNESLRF